MHFVSFKHKSAARFYHQKDGPYSPLDIIDTRFVDLGLTS
jgi:hypothetical protein